MWSILILTSIYELTVKQINAATLPHSQKVRKLADGAGLTLTLRQGADGVYLHPKLPQGGVLAELCCAAVHATLIR